MKKQDGASILMKMISSYIADKEIEDDEEAKVYADSLISQTKLYYKQQNVNFSQALASAGFESEDEYKDYLVSQYKIEQVTKKYVKEDVTDKEVEAYYKDNISEELNVKHILITPEFDEGASDQEKAEAESVAYNKAVDLINMLNQGADFEQLARDNSKDPGSASNGGIVNNVTKEGYVPEFYKAAYELNEGEYTTTPVKTKYGYHIIYLVKKNEKEPLENLKDTIKDSIVEEKLQSDQTLQITTWEKIENKYKLNINDTKLKNTYNSILENAKK